MRRKPLPYLPAKLLSLLLLAGIFLSSCSDECESTITYISYEPVYMKKAELKNSVKVEGARALQKPGKIYSFGEYLFVNEPLEGIHIIYNGNPASPQQVSFIAIPGNVDLAVKDHSLYADNYLDLVVLDILDPKAVKLVKRLENVFPLNGSQYQVNSDSFIARYEEKLVTAPYSPDCEEGVITFNGGLRGGQLFSAASAPAGGMAGKAGSMARFAITEDHLYTVGQESMQLFDIQDQANPVAGNKINLGWGIETIFPYQDKLFIGSTTGMHIYDNRNPVQPVRLSTYAHVNSCDPVVVEGDLAWVTLRSGNACAGFTNQLEVINISNPRAPKLVKTYPMQHPHGLGLDRNLLFLCEGAFGLKLFDVTNPLKVTDQLLKHVKNIHAYDVIPLGNVLLMIGDDGLYQYDYSTPSELKLLSKIPVKPAKA